MISQRLRRTTFPTKGLFPPYWIVKIQNRWVSCTVRTRYLFLYVRIIGPWSVRPTKKSHEKFVRKNHERITNPRKNHERITNPRKNHERITKESRKNHEKVTKKSRMRSIAEILTKLAWEFFVGLVSVRIFRDFLRLRSRWRWTFACCVDFFYNGLLTTRLHSAIMSVAHIFNTYIFASTVISRQSFWCRINLWEFCLSIPADRPKVYTYVLRSLPVHRR